MSIESIGAAVGIPSYQPPATPQQDLQSIQAAEQSAGDSYQEQRESAKNNALKTHVENTGQQKSTALQDFQSGVHSRQKAYTAMGVDVSMAERKGSFIDLVV